MAEYGNMMFLNTEMELKTFSPEIIQELQQEKDLKQEYNGIFLAQALRLLLIDLRRHRHQIFHHGRAELLHVFLRIAVAHHPIVTKLHIAVVAQLASHLIPQMHKLVELLDVLSTEGKAGGGYCTSIPDYEVPFIFANFNGTQHVDPQQFFPDCVALCRRQIGLLEYSVLEMVNHGCAAARKWLEEYDLEGLA